MKLVIPDEGKIDVSREISFFSKRLYHDHSWKGLSKVPKRLFTVVEAVEMNDNSGAAEEKVLLTQSEIIKNSILHIGDLGDKDYRTKLLKWLLVTKELIEIEINMLQKE